MTPPTRRPSTTKPALVLTAGRTVGFVIAFAMPIILTRLFSQEQYGTYRLIFVLFGSLYGLSQMGMAESLYFFVPRRPDRAGRYVLNAAVMMTAVGVVLLVGIVTLSSWISQKSGNPLLTAQLPALGVFVLLMLAAASLEIVVVSRQQYLFGAFIYAGSDAVKALLLVAPVVATGSLGALMLGAIGFAAVRCLVFLLYLLRRFKGHLRLDASLWREQLTYAVPFAVAGLVQIDIQQYAVAWWYGPTLFGIFAIGCTNVPLVDLFVASWGNVLMVRMSEEIRLGRSPAALWHEITSRLALVFLPLSISLLLTARELITVVFTRAYLASVPIFMVTVLGIVLGILPTDSVLRVYAQTRFLIVLNLARTAIIAAGIAPFLKMFGLPGAALITLVGVAFVKVAGVARSARLMHLNRHDVLPWRTLARTAVAAVVAAVPALVVRPMLKVPDFERAVIVVAVYGTAYLALSAALGLLPRLGLWDRLRLASRAE